MGDISVFMKELKQRYSIWYNKSHILIGTLWTERFKSLLVENDRVALMTVATYIDLNPVRAGLCIDPKDYRFCGYGESLGVPGGACEGIAAITWAKDWEEASQAYRMMLFGKGAQPKAYGGGAISEQQMQKVMKSGG